MCSIEGCLNFSNLVASYLWQTCQSEGCLDCKSVLECEICDELKDYPIDGFASSVELITV